MSYHTKYTLLQSIGLCPVSVLMYRARKARVCLGRHHFNNCRITAALIF